MPDGAWAVELNTETLPRVLVNRRYYAEVSGATRIKAERDYMSERLQQANWLVKALHQRATTILKVAREIVRQQDGFFRHGVQHLKPLVLRDIATEIGMHESTVSRVTSNKYIATPRGMFELKYFFTASVASASGGEALSAEAVRFRIKALIDGESGRNSVRRPHRRIAARRGHRHRPAHRRKISRGDAYSVVGAARRRTARCSPDHRKSPRMLTHFGAPAALDTPLSAPQGWPPKTHERAGRRRATIRGSRIQSDLMEIDDLITPASVVASLRVSGKRQALQELARRAAAADQARRARDFRGAVGARTARQTGIGMGTAVPHGKLPRLDRLYGVFARLERPIDFEAIDDQPVDLIFLLLAPENAGADHLKALARVSRLLRDRAMCEKLRGTDRAEALYALLTDRATSHAA